VGSVSGNRVPATDPFSGWHTLKYVYHPLALARQVPDLGTACADIRCRYIGMRTYVSEEFRHERLTKSHDLRVGFAFWIELRAALATAHRQTCKRILKDLFEREKLDDAGTDSRMKT